MYVCMYAVVAAAAVIIVIVLLFGGSSRRPRSGFGVRGACSYVRVFVCLENKTKERKKERKKREELECVGGVKRRKITRNWSVRTGRFVPIDIDNK